MLEYHTGIYSSIFLSAGRSYFETLGAYTDIIYNPLVDKGIGNKLWLDPLSKEDAVLNRKQAKVLIEDIPLWEPYLATQNLQPSTQETLP